MLSSNYLLLRDPAENALAGQSLGNPNNRQLRSWGTDLPSLATSSSQESALAQPAVAPASTSGSANSAATTAQPDGTPYQPVEWAKVILAAKVHGDASVSSPIISFYQAGTALQVLDRQNGWVQVADPASGESGWVFEQYLAPATGPTVTHTALETSASKPMAEPARANLVPGAKKRVRAPRPAVRMPKDVAMAQFERRWDRRAERRGGFGFFFGRFAGNEAQFR